MFNVWPRCFFSDVMVHELTIKFEKFCNLIRKQVVRKAVFNQPTPMQEPLTRKEREKQVRRQTMMAAAVTVFAEKGYEAASLDEIAARAEFGKGTLYLYFPGGKEEILHTIISDLFEQEIQGTEQILAAEQAKGSGFREMMRVYYREAIRFFRENHDLFRLVVKEVNRMMIGDDPQQAHHVMRARAQLVNRIVPYIRKAIAVGELRDMEPEKIGHMLIGSLHGFLMYDTFSCMMMPAAPPFPATINPLPIGWFL